MIDIERVDNTLKAIRNDMEIAIRCENAEERNKMYSVLLPQALVIAEILLVDKYKKGDRDI